MFTKKSWNKRSKRERLLLHFQPVLSQLAPFFLVLCNFLLIIFQRASRHKHPHHTHNEYAQRRKKSSEYQLKLFETLLASVPIIEEKSNKSKDLDDENKRNGKSYKEHLLLLLPYAALWFAHLSLACSPIHIKHSWNTLYEQMTRLFTPIFLSNDFPFVYLCRSSCVHINHLACNRPTTMKINIISGAEKS